MPVDEKIGTIQHLYILKAGARFDSRQWEKSAAKIKWGASMNKLNSPLVCPFDQ